MRSIPLFVTGVVLDVAGGAAVAGGAGLIAASSHCGPDATRGGCAVAGTMLDIAGVAALVGGAVILAIGIPLTVVGATSVPDVKSGAAPPRVRIGGRGGLLSGTF